MLINKDGKPMSRSEGEAVMKSRSSITVSIFAALLAICALLSNGNSGKILNNTIAANDVWAFYQAKSIKQTIAEQSRDDIKQLLDTQGNGLHQDQMQRMIAKIADLDATIARYESDVKSGEGKKELFAKAKTLEAEREQARHKSPWYGMASAALQIAIVLSTTSILGVSMLLLWGSVGVGVLGTAMLVNAYFMFIPWPF